MSNHKVVFVSTPIEPEASDLFVRLAPPGYEVDFANPQDGYENMLLKMEPAEVLVIYRSGILRDTILERTKNLKFIQSTSQGMDHIPVKAAIEKGIYVANINGGNAMAVAEFTVLLMLAAMRRLLPASEAVRTNAFKTDMTQFHQLHKKTVGIIGFGNIGRCVAEILQGFRANVIFAKQTPASEELQKKYQARQVSLDELLKTSDVIAVCVPNSPGTYRMLGKAQFDMMKPGVFLVNTARGAVVDEAAMIDALREKRIAGLGTDVFEREPPKPDHPLLAMENVVATPHIAGLAWDNWEPRIKLIWDNIQRVMRGEEPVDMMRL